MIYIIYSLAESTTRVHDGAANGATPATVDVT